MQDSINKQQVLLLNAYEEKSSLEQMLERTSQLYRQAHNERRQLVNTWKEAVNQMNQREKDINETEKVCIYNIILVNVNFKNFIQKLFLGNRKS